jgi:hypothetical protein
MLAMMKLLVKHVYTHMYTHTHTHTHTHTQVLERKLAMMKLLVKHMSVLNLFAQTRQGNTPLVRDLLHCQKRPI